MAPEDFGIFPQPLFSNTLSSLGFLVVLLFISSSAFLTTPSQYPLLNLHSPPVQKLWLFYRLCQCWPFSFSFSALYFLVLSSDPIGSMIISLQTTSKFLCLASGSLLHLSLIASTTYLLAISSKMIY